MKRVATLLTFLALFAQVPSQADTGTLITSGAMTFEQTFGRIELRGQSGFRLSAGVDVSGGIYDPWNQCSVPECPPGTDVSLFAHWGGQDLSGTLRLNGHTYALGSEGEGGAFGTVTFEGHVVLPEYTESGTAEASAPFTFTGQVTPEPCCPAAEPLSGSGIATLFLSKNFDGSSWQIDGAVYAFAKKATTTVASQ